MCIAPILLIFAIFGVEFARAATPANDDWTNATPILSLPFSDTVDIKEATNEVTFFCFPRPQDVWYAFVPTDNVEIEITTPPDTTQLSVFLNEPTATNVILCDGKWFSRFSVVAGRRYLIRVGRTPDQIYDFITHGIYTSNVVSFSLTRVPDFWSAAIVKTREFHQTGKNDWAKHRVFTFEAYAAFNHRWDSTTVQTLAPRHRPWTLTNLVESPIFSFQRRCSSLEALDRRFPPGVYRFEVDPIADVPNHRMIALPRNDFPAPVRLAAFSTWQHVDSAQEFWFAWYPLKDTDYENLWMIFEIEDTDHRLVFSDRPNEMWPWMDLRSNYSVIPGGTLSPGHRYRGKFTLFRTLRAGTESEPTSYTFTTYTIFPIRTL